MMLWHLSILLVTTMPKSYFFGLKAKLLDRFSRSLLYKGYVRASPGVTGLTVILALLGSLRVGRVTSRRWRGLILANGLLAYVQNRLYELFRGDASPLLSLEDKAADRELVNWQPVSQEALAAMTFPQRCTLPPVVLLGGETLPRNRSRLLFVGNHAIWGLDVPLLLNALYSQENIFPRPLGSHAWFAAPLANEVMGLLLGAVDGTQYNCDLLMSKGANLLVYPGGEREAWKKSSDAKYSLLWGDNKGFARMALRHSYTIIPVATVGTEDAFQVVADFPLSKVLRLGGLIPAPKSKQLGGNAFQEGATLPLLVPRRGRTKGIYFKLGRPIPARLVGFGFAEAGEVDSNPYVPTDQEVIALRDDVRTALEEEVAWLLKYQAQESGGSSTSSTSSTPSKAPTHQVRSKL